VALCSSTPGELTAAGIVQTFIGTSHETAIAEALATAEDQALTADLAGEHLRAGVARYWQQAERAGTAKAPADVPTTAEEVERLRQLEFVRRAAADAIGTGNGLETR
jgi:3-hydroxyisobutyrate dehydrogenase-like beta-hydroxyacid dehydrogenase